AVLARRRSHTGHTSSVYRHSAHPPLYSFPTRRSSDLTQMAWKHADFNVITHTDGDCYARTWIRLQETREACKIVTQLCEDLPARTEEHTSELQSRENLVCRLLLEKKKHEEMDASTLAA